MTDVQLLFLSIIRSDRPVVFLQVTFLLKMDFESITYIKSVVLYPLSYRFLYLTGVEPATPTSVVLTTELPRQKREWESNP